MAQGLKVVAGGAEKRRYSDSREAPRYTPAELARYLYLPESTVRAWFFDQRGFGPLLEPADPDARMLSFYNLVEAHALSWTRQKYKKITARRLRHALEFVRKEFPQYPRPLVTKRFSTDGKFLFVQDLGASESDSVVQEATTINASKWGQLLLPSMNEVLELIEYDQSDLAKVVYPKEGRGVVAINPRVSSGRPIMSQRGVLASIVHQRIVKAGEPIERIAMDYGLTSADIQAAIDYIEAA